MLALLLLIPYAGEISARFLLPHNRIRGRVRQPRSQMLSGELPRLRYNESDAVVAVSDQIIVAKEKTGAQRRSDDAEFGKDWFYRCVKSGPCQRLKIKLKTPEWGHIAAPLPASKAVQSCPKQIFITCKRFLPQLSRVGNLRTPARPAFAKLQETYPFSNYIPSVGSGWNGALEGVLMMPLRVVACSHFSRSLSLSRRRQSKLMGLGERCAVRH